MMNLYDMPLEKLKNYKPELTRKEDFASFWKKTLKQTLNQPLNSELKEKDYSLSQVKTYDIYFDGFLNSRIHGRYILPVKTDSTLPLVIMFHGYSWNNIQIADVLHYILMNCAVLLLDVRGQNTHTPDHNKYVNGGPTGWMTKGILDPHNYYYRLVYMDCVRAVKFADRRKEIDSDRIAVEGHSQGGGLALAVGALSSQVKLVMSDTPFLCHFRRGVELYERSPYEEIYKYFKALDSLHKTEDRVYETLSYFDCMNLAVQIKAKVLMSIGLEDVVCPPSTAFAAYNHLATEKEIRIYPEYGHGGFRRHKEEKIKFLQEHLL